MSAPKWPTVRPGFSPPAVVATLVKHIHAMQDDPEVTAALARGGLEPLKETPAQFSARMRADHERFRDIVKAAKLKPE